MRYLNATDRLRGCRGVRSVSVTLGALLAVLLTAVALADEFDNSAALLEVPVAESEIAPNESMAPAETWPDGQPVAPEPSYASPGDYATAPNASPEEEYAGNHGDHRWGSALLGPRYYTPVMSWLGLRHSYTNGRNVGLGGPLVGTSWLNRPYYWGGEIGTLWMTRGLGDGVSRDTDAFGGVFFGWDWDHYWGSEFRFDWSTPELENRLAPSAPRTDSLFIWNYSFMYYPWGDSHVRPYWRLGIGNTHVDFPTQWETRNDEWLMTFPIGLGVKYPIRRWLTARTEFTDQLAVGRNDIPTQHNLTLTFGLEWHFGVRPKSYFPWYPSRHYH